MNEFDPNQFLNSSITEPLTKRPPINPGSYIAMIGEPKAKQWSKQDPESGEMRTGVVLSVPLTIDLPSEEASKVGQPQVTITGSIFLDMKEDGVSLDSAPGKNRQLRAYREALDLNKPGDQFSYAMMQGRQIRVAVKHDAKNGEVYERIGAVARA